MNTEKRLTAAINKLTKVGGYGSQLELVFNVNGEFGELYLTTRGGHWQWGRRLWAKNNAYDDTETWTQYKRQIIAMAPDFATEIEQHIIDRGNDEKDGEALLKKITSKPFLAYSLS